MRSQFGTFEFDHATLELRRDGRLVKLEPQPARALALLLARPGELVTRDDLRAALWGADTHVDFDRGLTYAVGQVRAALGDSGDNPRFLQTLPKRGFRFVAPVRVVATGPAEGGTAAVGAPAVAGPPVAWSPPGPASVPLGPAATSVAPPATASAGAVGPVSRRAWPLLAGVLVGAVAALVTVSGMRGPAPVPVVAVSVFDNETGDPAFDRPVTTLADVVVVRLTSLAPGRLGVVGNAAVLRRPRNIRDLAAVKTGVQADYVLLGQLQRDGAGLRFVTHVVRLADGVHLKANRLTGPADDASWLDRDVPDEFVRAVQGHVLGAAAP